MRRSILLLLVTLVVACSGCGIPTKEVHTSIKQEVPRQTWFLPLGNSLPPNVVAAQNTVSPTPPPFAQPYIQQHSPDINDTVELKTEVHYTESSIRDVTDSIAKVAGVGLAGVDVISNIDFRNRHPHDARHMRMRDDLFWLFYFGR